LKIRFFLSSFLLFSSVVISKAQVQSNLTVIHNLIHKSAAKADSIIAHKGVIYLSVSSPKSLEILKPVIMQSFTDIGYTLKSSSAEADIELDYILSSAKVEYPNAFLEGFFGSTQLERNISTDCSLLITNKDKTIKSFELNEIENQNLPFTKGKVPSQPFFTGFWEPIIAVSTLILTVILLFTIRSK
jgi:hypothetical protein